MITIEIVGLSLLLVGNLLVLKWLVVSDPAEESDATEATGFGRSRTETSHFRRAA